MNDTPTIHAIADRQPEFPCWLFNFQQKFNGLWEHSEWAHVKHAYAAHPQEYSHWSPNAPEKPSVRPETRHDDLLATPDPAFALSPKPGLKEAVGGELPLKAIIAVGFTVGVLEGSSWDTTLPQNIQDALKEARKKLTDIQPWLDSLLALTPATPPIQPIQAHKDDSNGAAFLKARIATLEGELKIAKADLTREVDLCDSMAKQRVPLDDDEVREFVLMALSRHTLLNSDERQDCADQILTAFAPTYAKLEEAQLAAAAAESP